MARHSLLQTRCGHRHYHWHWVECQCCCFSCCCCCWYVVVAVAVVVLKICVKYMSWLLSVLMSQLFSTSWRGTGYFKPSVDFIFFFIIIFNDMDQALLPQTSFKSDAHVGCCCCWFLRCHCDCSFKYTCQYLCQNSCAINDSLFHIVTKLSASCRWCCFQLSM